MTRHCYATRSGEVLVTASSTSGATLVLAEITRLARQLRELSERYALRSEELRTRLLGLLSIHLAETGDSIFRSTREELASWVVATREAVIRAVRDLEADGIVILRRGAAELKQAG